MARLNNDATTMVVRDILNPKKTVVITLAGDTCQFTKDANKTCAESDRSVDDTKNATGPKTKRIEKSKNNSNHIVHDTESLSDDNKTYWSQFFIGIANLSTKERMFLIILVGISCLLLCTLIYIGFDVFNKIVYFLNNLVPCKAQSSSSLCENRCRNGNDVICC